MSWPDMILIAILVVKNYARIGMAKVCSALGLEAINVSH